VASNAAKYQHQIYTEKLEKEQDLFQAISPKVFENAMIRDRDPYRRNNVLMTTPNSRASST
jgi:hypothetical protein